MPDETRGTVTPDWADTAPEGRIIAQVWMCEDECTCSQAQIIHVEGWIPPRMYDKRSVLWKGKFHSGDVDEFEEHSYADLNREAKRLRKTHRELRRRISWPWDRHA